MKYLLYFFTALVLFPAIFSCNNSKQLSATPKPLNLYQSLPDEKEKKSLVGILTEEQVTGDTSFHWYQANLKYYKLDSATVQAIRSKKDKIHLVLFMGTWCHDSQQLVPKYFETLKAANFDSSHLTIIATDRNKKTIAGLHHAYNLENVPTMIVLQNGKEVGRVVEYGSTTFVDKELGELMQKVE
jgi:thiol-disulfide isomerase/thioredoxin